MVRFSFGHECQFLLAAGNRSLGMLTLALECHLFAARCVEGQSLDKTRGSPARYQTSAFGFKLATCCGRGYLLGSAASKCSENRANCRF